MQLQFLAEVIGANQFVIQFIYLPVDNGTEVQQLTYLKTKAAELVKNFEAKYEEIFSE